MMVKVGNGYLELNELIEVEKKVKLLEDISTVDGDFSYSFSIPSTHPNEELIAFYSINNTNVPWAFRIPAEIQDDSGITLYAGYIRGESFDEETRSYQASFFSGNSTWIEELNFHLSEVIWTPYDRDQFPQAIVDSWARTSGIVWPLTDKGALSTRSTASLFEDDFHPFIYYKDIVSATLNKAGIKIKGDLLTDPIYNKLITSNNGRKGYENRIEQRHTKAGKTVLQTISSVYEKAEFPNVSDPYYNSEFLNWNTTLSRYVFDTNVKEASFTITLKLASSRYFSVRLRYNGSSTLWERDFKKTKLISVTLNSRTDLDVNIAGFATGDYVELEVGVTYAIFADVDLIVGSFFEVKPVKFFTAFADAIVPDMTGTELLSEAFRVFNIIPAYNQITKEIDTRKFYNIVNEEPIDISDHVTINEDNYSEFVSDYAKRNLFIWEDQSSDDVDQYNEDNAIPYGGGYIDINNEFLEAEDTLVEMAFVSAFQKSYPAFGTELTALNYVTVVTVDDDTVNITSVTDNSGVAQFNHSGSISRALIRITNSTNESYNGDYVIVANTPGWFLLQDVLYDGNATALVTGLSFEDVNNDEQVLLINNENVSIADYTGVESIEFEGNTQTRMSIANFKAYERFRGSLEFGAVDEPNTLVSRYYSIIVGMLNTGVKSFGSALLPALLYRQIDFLRPLLFKDNKRSVLYYPNKLTGYVSSKISAVIELIKLK